MPPQGRRRRAAMGQRRFRASHRLAVDLGRPRRLRRRFTRRGTTNGRHDIAARVSTRARALRPWLAPGGERRARPGLYRSKVRHRGNRAADSISSAAQTRRNDFGTLRLLARCSRAYDPDLRAAGVLVLGGARERRPVHSRLLCRSAGIPARARLTPRPLSRTGTAQQRPPDNRRSDHG